MKKQIISLALAALVALPTLSMLSGCSGQQEIVLRIYSWEEYIDEGGGEGSDSYIYDEEHKDDPEDPSMIDDAFKAWYLQTTGVELDVENTPRMIDDFELWYEKTYNTPIRIEYSTFGTNEDMYNQLKLGDAYDLICPSEYMIMKLAAENMLEPFSDSFYDTSIEENYYAKNVSPFIREVFDSHTVTVTDENQQTSEHAWSEYAAGYMWGTTGLVYNPETVSAEDVSRWNVLLNPEYQNEVTTKDNVRDSYSVGLAVFNEDELLALQAKHREGVLDDSAYLDAVTEIMNRTDEQTVNEVQEILLDLKENIYGFETDTGKSDLVKGIISINFAWSGDAVYAMDLAEEEDVYLNFSIPEEGSTMYFDGWVMPKGAQREAAEAFINFISMPYNAVRNMYYIGYTSVLASQEIFDYVDYMYSAEEGDDSYDLSYFFGDSVEDATLLIDSEQRIRQLGAQYPTKETMLRCAVMDYFDPETNDRINTMWTKVKGATLDAWAIIVVCVGVIAIIGGVLLAKFGGKIDFFRPKPKKGYKLVKQEKIDD